ncbi:MAG: filamentous hemagglutinin N-terminal domain-containing protein, partial [Cyanothece sp. SIO2G6]|nr:filamentous hemagglutinin N-terminal domain-containing protein [Cyanothece sp. SIO2G6]
MAPGSPFALRSLTPMLVSTFLLSWTGTAIAQIRPDDSLGEERSRLTPGVNVRGDLADLIEGGARRGDNLFHSFEDFSVQDLQRVYFANPDGIANILSRITGSSRSDILGTLGVDGAANLFLINPNGIVFGPNAVLDVDGAFLASTAEHLIFDDGSLFSAVDPDAPPLVTVNIPIGVQFGPNPPASIINEANLEVGGDLTLAAGTVTNIGNLTAGGQVQVTETVPAQPQGVSRVYTA